MQFDSCGFTGPSTSYDRSDGSHGSPFLRSPTSDERASFFCRRDSSRRSEAREPQPTGDEARRSWGCDRPLAWSARCQRRSVELGDGFQTGNATAFHVSYYSRVHCIRALANDFEEDDDRRARKLGNDQCRELEESEDKEEAGSDPADDLSRTVSRETGSRSRRAGKPRTRWKKKDDDDRARFEKSVNFSPIPTADDPTNVSSVDAFPYTAYNDEDEDENEGDAQIASAREIEDVQRRKRFSRQQDDGTTRGKGERSRGHHRRVRDSRGEKRESYYTARFQEPITNESCGNETTEPSTNGPTTTKVSNSCGRKYGLLFVLYLLAAWPLVCSTNPPGQFVSSFASDSSSLGSTERLSRHNATQISSLLSSSGVAHQWLQHQQQQQQQHTRQTEEKRGTLREQLFRDVRDRERKDNGVDGRHHRRHDEEQQDEQQTVRDRRQREVRATEPDETHPYNEYSWEVNQINPWLSACDLAGPTPADLQGSCGPPEVPKNCPVPCSSAAKEKGKDAGFLEVIQRVELAGRNCYWSKGSERPVSGREETDDDDGVPTTPEQCLFYLEESHKRDICRDDFGRSSTRSFFTSRENRYWFMSGLRLRHCCEHAVVNALAPGKGGPLENVLNGGQKCTDALDKLLLVDALAARLHCEFEEVLARYDCAQSYSVIFNCTHCKEAYRKWVCSSLVPYFAHGGPQDLDSSNSWAGSRLKPCRSFCQSVEQRCPYLLPGDRAPAYPTQYAGEPTFLCTDPNIPETGKQAARAVHSTNEDECCFHACSEELPGSGICANCTDRELRRRGRSHDPPTAPRCEVNTIQPASTGVSRSTESSPGEKEELEESSTVSGSSPATGSITERPPGTLLCGSSGGASPVVIGSVSSSNRSSVSSLPQLFWLCVLNSVLGDILTILVFWIPRMFTGRSASVTGSVGGGTTTMDIVVWLRSCLASRYRSAGYGARWLLKKWVVVERRFRSWWWCCWYWWWWRWRRTRSKKYRSRRRSRGSKSRRRFAATTRRATSTILVDPTSSTAATVSICESFHDRFSSTRRDNYYCFLVDSFAAKCPWRRWSWWWWWLYRWRRSRKSRYTNTGRETWTRRRTGRRRSRRESSAPSRIFEEDVRSSPARRRYFKLSSRKDPP
ncbi:uncharacterized protein LOC108626159 [Ceratina calcarata]|uniref:Uncharacterized protein LOC108626159 n=1 Tax=Ceratina calcarata TaxID=156304 RepID=A0AAJ7J149_9HYME|nr:uncharacterized protein LOC108626159 [Ceratina calcarata]